MTEFRIGFSDEKTIVPDHRGERVAVWVEVYIHSQNVSVSELAFRLHQDRRDIQRLINMRSCGHRLEDALASAFGWPFVEAIMAPLIDNKTGVEIAKELAEIDAHQARIRSLLLASKGHRSGPRMVSQEEWDLAAPPRSKV